MAKPDRSKSTNRARSRAIRARMALTGESFTVAARRHDADQTNARHAGTTRRMTQPAQFIGQYAKNPALQAMASSPALQAVEFLAKNPALQAMASSPALQVAEFLAKNPAAQYVRRNI